MTRRFFLVCGLIWAVAFCLCGPGTVASAQDEIGRVIGLAGEVRAERDGESRALTMQAPIYAHDTLKTGADGKLQVILNDDTTLNLGDTTVLAMRDFAYPGEQSSFKAHLFEGAARVITGAIVEMNPEGFAFSTPDATVGIRGTIVGALVQTGQATATGTLSTIMNINSMGKTVSANGLPIAQNTLAVFAGARLQRQGPISPDQIERFNRGVLIGYARPSGPPAGESALASAPAGFIGKSGLDLANAYSPVQTIADGLNAPQLSGSTALVSGTLVSVVNPGGEGVFQFSVNLANGNAFDASMSGGFFSGTPHTYSATGGSGGLNGGSYLIDFPSASVIFDGQSGGIATLFNSQGAVPSVGAPWSGEYFVSGNALVDEGTAAGAVTAVGAVTATQ